MREIYLGVRPRGEREFICPGEEHYQDVAHIEAFAFVRMLDRVFWHPDPAMLRFQVCALAEGGTRVYSVAAVVSPEGEAWFSQDLIPSEWDRIAHAEVTWGLSRFQRRKMRDEGLLPEDHHLLAGGPQFPDFSDLADPRDVAQYRWAVLSRLRAKARERRTGSGD